MVVMHQGIQIEFFQACLPVFMRIKIGEILGVLNLEISYDNIFYGAFIHSGIKPHIHSGILFIHKGKEPVPKNIFQAVRHFSYNFCWRCFSI